MICYGKNRDIFPLSIRETDDYMHRENSHKVPDGTELYVESSAVYTDEEGNLWMKSSKSNSYFELYRRKLNKVLFDFYPTMYASVTTDCKAGLGMYKTHSFQSDEIDRKKPDELYEITSDFFVDERENIWVRCIEITETDHGYHRVEGWVPYKTRRNNFLNLLIHGKYSVMTSDGVLDDEKVEYFKEYIARVNLKDFYKVVEPLQLFAKKKSGNSVKVGNGKKALKVSSNSGDTQIYSSIKSTTSKVVSEVNDSTNNTKKYADVMMNSHYKDPKISGTGSNRKSYPYKGRKNANPAKGNITRKAIVQNEAHFPPVVGYDSDGNNVYNYFMNYVKDGINDNNARFRRHLNYAPISKDVLFKRNVALYNRFKLANPADILSRGFPHVFFTRPDCNIFSDMTGTKARSRVAADPTFARALSNKKELLMSLQQVTNSAVGNCKFWNMFLSNKAESFSLTDESIDKDSYGTTYRKNKVSYGKSNEESKGSGEFTVDFRDTRDLDIFQINKLWTDYISNVYVGKWYPKSRYLWQKALDYACSVYYIITAEDGETIIFWSKYYGVFPLNTPSSAYSWTSGSPIENQKLQIQYAYSWKEDYNPQSMVEFNINSGVNSSDSVTYMETYNPHIGTVGNTWVGTPFIDTVSYDDKSYDFKLRFMKGVHD